MANLIYVPETIFHVDLMSNSISWLDLIISLVQIH
jgi:hypothetical protein